MAIHFSRDEFLERQRKTLDAMAARGLDALLIFKQESIPGSVRGSGLNQLLTLRDEVKG